MLERGRVEDVVDPAHCVADALNVADIAYVELDFVVVVGFAHVVLLFLVTAENADLADISRQKMLEHGVAKAAGAAGGVRLDAGGLSRWLWWGYVF